MMPRSYRSLFWLLVVIGFVLDLGTKYGMFRGLWNASGEGRFEVLPGVFRFIAQFEKRPDGTFVEPADGDWRAPLLAAPPWTCQFPAKHS